jgi:hypothetical protein
MKLQSQKLVGSHGHSATDLWPQLLLPHLEEKVRRSVCRSTLYVEDLDVALSYCIAACFYGTVERI